MAILTKEYQRIATGGSQSFGYATGYLELWAKYNSQDIVNNKTNYSVELRLVVTGGYIGNYQSTPYSLSSTGLTAANGDGGAADYISRTITTITGDVEHNSSGAKSVSMNGAINFTAWGRGLSVSGSADLPTIPRTSEVACSSPYIGDAATITIDRKNANFTDTLTYTIGNITGTIAEKTSEKVLSLDTSKIANEIYALIPNDKSIEGTINCITYNEDTEIGASSCKFNLYTFEDRCKPDVSGTVEDTNETTIAITGDKSKLIKYLSKPKVTVQATAKNSSTISSYSINLNDGQTSDLQEDTFESIGSNNITVNATDSRGYSGSKDLTLEMIDYVKLHIDSIDISRPEDVSNEVILNANGVWFNGNFTAANKNTLTARFQYKSSNDSSWIDGGTITPTINGNTFAFTDISLGSNYDYNYEYQFKIILSDKLMTTGSENKEAITVPKGQEVVAIGEDAVWVYGNLFLNDKEVRAAEGCPYDIGDIYITENPTHPSTKWSGTAWEQIKEMFLLGAGDTYKAGSTGGEAKVTLKPEEMPRHAHPQYVTANANSGGTAIREDYTRDSTGSTRYLQGADTGEVGGNQPHNNMPPYLTVYIWKRIS